MPQVEEVPLKLVIVGDGGCGKSALLLAYTEKSFDFKYIPTVVDTYDVLMALGENRNLQLTVVDTAGQEEFKNIRTLALRGCDVTIVTYSCESLDSLKNVSTRWVPEVKEINPTAPFVLVGNKADMYVAGEEEHVKKSVARKVGTKLGAYTTLQCSAMQFATSKGKIGNVDKVFKAAIKIGLIKKNVIEDDSKPWKQSCGGACTVL